jgi:hypothetical protein
MTDEEKNPYEILAAEDRRRYDNECRVSGIIYL